MITSKGTIIFRLHKEAFQLLKHFVKKDTFSLTSSQILINTTHIKEDELNNIIFFIEQNGTINNVSLCFHQKGSYSERFIDMSTHQKKVYINHTSSISKPLSYIIDCLQTKPLKTIQSFCTKKQLTILESIQVGKPLTVLQLTTLSELINEKEWISFFVENNGHIEEIMVSASHNTFCLSKMYFFDSTRPLSYQPERWAQGFIFENDPRKIKVNTQFFPLYDYFVSNQAVKINFERNQYTTIAKSVQLEDGTFVRPCEVCINRVKNLSNGSCFSCSFSPIPFKN